jgi:mycofactocin precursor
MDAASAVVETTFETPVEEAATATLERPVELETEELLVEDVSIDGMCGVY